MSEETYIAEDVEKPGQFAVFADDPEEFTTRADLAYKFVNEEACKMWCIWSGNKYEPRTITKQ